MFKEKFLKRLKELGLDETIYDNYPRKAFRLAKGKDKIPWADGFWGDAPVKGYSQDAVSMVPAVVLGATKTDVVLDMCAAPGSKTLQLCDMAKHVVANDISRRRLVVLKKNLEKYGITNCKVMCRDGRFIKIDNINKILVDAPCSGEGMVAKIDKVMKVWSEKRIKRLSKIQRKLLLNAVDLTDVVVYSTCTFAPEENECVIDYVLKRRDVKVEKIDVKNLKYVRGVSEWRGKKYNFADKIIRIYPFHNQANGMFIAKISQHLR
jgi:16S rRNA C967 or C1407 C5-methylase (RsmB/RsmF family)